jgi:hypothetical protein
VCDTCQLQSALLKPICDEALPMPPLVCAMLPPASWFAAIAKWPFRLGDVFVRFFSTLQMRILIGNKGNYKYAS